MPSRHSSSRLLSPPWLAGGSPFPNSALHLMAPLMPSVPLPRCCDDHYPPQPSPHHSLMTPPLSPALVHPALSAAPTMVRYNLTHDPSTIRMSAAAPHRSFPNHDPASSPSAPVLNIRCERTGQVISVYAHNGAVTCLDLLVQLYRYFNQEIPSHEWRSVRGEHRNAMKESYTRRTGLTYTVSARMRRIDYLCGRSTFKGIIPEYVDASGSTWLLQTC